MLHNKPQKMRVFFCSLLISALFCPAALAALDLSEIGVGARPLGMGRAYVGVADDASSIFTNPAGLSQNDTLNVTTMSGAMLGDVNYIVLGAANETPLGKFGFGYINASVGGIPLTALVGSGPSLEAQQYSTAGYGSNQFVFSYGTKMSRILRGAGGNFALGANLKFFTQGFSGGGATPSGGANPLTGATGSGLDADLGFQWQANDWARLGLVFQNFLPESFGGKFTWQNSSGTEGIPQVIRFGGQFHVLGPALALRRSDAPLDVSLDYENNSSQNRPSIWRLGLEYQPLPMFFLRAGLDQQPKAAEAGIGVDNNLTLGVGLALGGFTFDYAYHQFGDLSENTTHFFSLGFRGAEKPSALIGKVGRPEKKKPTIPAPEVVAKPLLKVFGDVPDNYWAHNPIQYLATLNIMDGYSDGTFQPTKEINRGELAVLLVKAKNFSVGEVKTKFSDVAPQSYEEPFISFAVERKYIEGFPDGTFQPIKRVTRAEAALILARFSGFTLKPKLQQRPFDDVSVGHWAAPAIAAARDAGLFEYLAGKSFGPDLYLTRAEAAEIISKTTFAKQQIEKLISGE